MSSTRFIFWFCGVVATFLAVCLAFIGVWLIPEFEKISLPFGDDLPLPFVFLIKGRWWLFLGLGAVAMAWGIYGHSSNRSFLNLRAAWAFGALALIQGLAIVLVLGTLYLPINHVCIPFSCVIEG